MVQNHTKGSAVLVSFQKCCPEEPWPRLAYSALLWMWLGDTLVLLGDVR